ncbi:MAG: glycosyltransferase family 1 protein [Verrucomicrobiota bacterium]
MRIALSTSVIQRGKSGVGQYVFALVKAMLSFADRHEFHLLVLEDDLPLFAFAAGRMKLVPVPEKWRPALRNIVWHQVVLPRWLRQQRMDVLHIPSYRRMLWSAPCARVSTIHDLAPFHVSGKYDWARMFYGRVVVRQLARRQTQVIAISSNTAHDIRRFFGVEPSRLHIIHNGIDHQRFTVGDAAQARHDAARRWRFDRPFFLYVSRLEHPAKNHVRLIEAFNQFKSQTGADWLLVLGGSDWHGAEHIHAMAKTSPFVRDIRFLGFVPDDVLPELYRAASAMVYPSLFEGFGFPPIEAMACGCPVISSTRGSLGEVVGDAAEIVEPESVASITSALCNMATNEPRRTQLRTAGFHNARRFDWAMNAKQVIDTYERAVIEFGKGRMTGAKETTFDRG